MSRLSGPEPRHAYEYWIKRSAAKCVDKALADETANGGSVLDARMIGGVRDVRHWLSFGGSLEWAERRTRHAVAAMLRLHAWIERLIVRGAR